MLDNWKSHTRALLALACVIASQGPVDAAYIINGSFEYPAVPPGRYDTFGPPSAIPGWTVIAGDVDINAANPFGLPYDGAQWLDLNGNGPGALEQSFATTVGASYVLSFAYANNAATGGATARATVLGAGPTPLLQSDFSHEGSTTAEMGYQLYLGTFTANSGTTTLRFESTYSGPSGVALDAVSVTDAPTTATPEPSSLHLLLFGCLSLSLLGYSRKTQRKPVSC